MKPLRGAQVNFTKYLLAFLIDSLIVMGVKGNSKIILSESGQCNKEVDAYCKIFHRHVFSFGSMKDYCM